jgi:hypothetical protein
MSVIEKIEIGNIVILNDNGVSEDKRFPKYFRRVVEYDAIRELITVEDSLGNKSEVIFDFYLSDIPIREELLLHLGFKKNSGVDGVYSKGLFLIKKQGWTQYQVCQLASKREMVSCLYELQNLYKEYTGKDLDVSDFNDWNQFSFSD